MQVEIMKTHGKCFLRLHDLQGTVLKAWVHSLPLGYYNIPRRS